MKKVRSVDELIDQKEYYIQRDGEIRVGNWNSETEEFYLSDCEVEFEDNMIVIPLDELLKFINSNIE